LLTNRNHTNSAQRRKIEPAFEDVSDAGFAADRDTLANERGVAACQIVAAPSPRHRRFGEDWLGVIHKGHSPLA
jgi:hypothetical protein